MYKAYPKRWVYSWGKAKKTFEGAKREVKSGHKTGTTCVVPIRWALKMMGLNPDGFWGYKGSFKGYDADLKKKLKIFRKTGPVGYTIKQAVDKGLLKPGDIIAFKGRTHTVAYSGTGYKVYEGGHVALWKKFKNGILLDYSKVLRYKGKKISSVLRWK